LGFTTVMVAAVAAQAAGTIVQTGATIAAGAAPTPGVVTIDPAAPIGVVPTIPPIPGPGGPPTLTGSMPPLPSFGDGSDGAFVLNAGTVALPPGTHQFTSFSVTDGATVTLSDATIILVTGDVSIAGSVVSTVAGGSITLRCGGSFTLVSRNPASLVQTTMATSPIEIVAGGMISVGTNLTSLDAQVSAQSSDVMLEAHGMVAGTSGVSIRSGQVLAPAGAVTVRATGPFEMGGTIGTRQGRIDCLGPLLIQSFADRIAANSNGDFYVTGGPATFEAATQLLLGGDLSLAGTFPLSLTAVAGPVDLYGVPSTVDGDLTLATGGDVHVFGGGLASTGFGNVSIASGGVVSMNDGSLSSASGDLDLVATQSVLIGGAIDAGGTVTIRVSEGEFRMSGSASLTASLAASIHAAGTIDIGPPAKKELTARWPRIVTRGSDVILDCGAVDVAGGADVTIDAVTARAGGDGGFRVLAQGPIAVGRTISGRADVSLQSIAGDVDVAEAIVRSEDMGLDGSVTVETWLAGGRIDATNATIQSGASTSTSGAVSVLVHDPGDVGAVESFILPKKVTVKTSAGAPEKTRLVAAGFYDVGTGAVAFTDAATIRVGSQAFAVPADGFVPNKTGSIFKYVSDELRVKIIPNKLGSSRARCRLDARGAVLDGKVPVDGDVDLSFQFGAGLAGGGTVSLTAGKYALGRKRGALVAPNLFPARVKATLKGAGKDALLMIAGLATDGVTPAAAPDLRVDFGTGFTLERSSAEFTRKGDKYVAPGVVLDYLKETLTVKVKDLDLAGAFAEGPQPVDLRVELGADAREVRVRVVRKGKKLVY
jgi:hypothetical protein